MSKVELFEQIRREHEFGGKSIRGLARELGVHRRMVREAIRTARPTPRKRPERMRPKLGPAIEFIDYVIRADQKAPRKQRHTAKRIHTRIGQELLLEVAEGSVRKYVHDRKRVLGLLTREVYVPQAYGPGAEGQADWYEAQVVLCGEPVTVQIFAVRACYSGDALHVAFPRATQQAFLQAHEEAFHYFGGVFHRLRYDNLTSAVKKILRGRQRVETERFMAFRSHWRFMAEFCNPARGNEKGGVEGEVGRFRRNHLVPVPQVDSFAELNEYLQAQCYGDRQRRIAGREETVGEALAQERVHLLPLVEPFDVEERSQHWVDSQSRVVVRTNRYSVPAGLVGRRVEVRVSAQQITIYHEGRAVAQHERCYSRRQERLQLDHYLEVLDRKPGALAGSRPLAQMRADGHWPESYDRMWAGLKERYGVSDGTRQMIGLLRKARAAGRDALTRSIEQALAWGCFDGCAVELFMTEGEPNRPAATVLEVGALQGYDRPQPGVANYDQLLKGREEVACR